MYYTDTRQIWPNTALNAELRIPKTALLQGLMYDFTDHSLITWDNTEKKLMWISRDDASVRASAIVSENFDSVMGMTSFQDNAYILAYEGNGRAAVYTGAISVGRENNNMPLQRHPLPYNDASYTGQTIRDRTHRAIPTYLKYHPMFCDIFNIGPTLYLLVGTASDVTPTNIPDTLGQYIVEYELDGMFRNHIMVDFTSSGNRWPGEEVLNGTGMTACHHDGVVDMVSLEKAGVNVAANTLRTLRYNGGSLSTARVNYDNAWYLANIAQIGTDIMVVGKYAYLVINNKIYKSVLTTFKIEMNTGWPNTHAVDLGSLVPKQTVYRKLTVKNTAAITMYHDITITSNDPMLRLSLTNSVIDTDYAESVTFKGNIGPGETFTFYIMLTAPDVGDEDIPYQYYNKIYFKPDRKSDII